MSRRKYHQSELALFLKCGLAYEFRYVQGIKTPPKAALTLGKAVDRAVTTNLIEKIKTGADLPKDAVLDAFSTEFDAAKPETVWDDSDPGEEKDMGVKLVTLHHEQAAPRIKPVTVQEEFIIETDAGYDLGGTFDHTEADGTVADTKTSKTSYDQEDLHGLQPVLYDFAYEALRGKPATGFRFDVLVKGGKKAGPKYEPIQGKPTQADREHFFYTVNQVDQAIRAGVALPAPEGSWWCSKKWCGFAGICPKFKGRK